MAEEDCFKKLNDMQADIGFPRRSIHPALNIHDKFIKYKESVHLTVSLGISKPVALSLSQQAHACLKWGPMEKLIAHLRHDLFQIHS